MKSIHKVFCFLIYSVSELFFVFLLFVVFMFGNVSLRGEYEALHESPIYFFAMRSCLGIFLSAIFALLQTSFLIFGRRVIGIEKYSYRKIFLFHLLVFSFFSILLVIIRFYSVLSSDPSERLE